jgi:hypothetical protein
MPDLQVVKTTALRPAEVMVCAEQFFASERWRVKLRNGCFAIFEGRPRADSLQLVFVFLLSLCLVIPGVAYYALAVRRQRRVQTVAVTAKPRGEHCEVLVEYQPGAERLMTVFLATLV